jgi:hypothetical protein
MSRNFTTDVDTQREYYNATYFNNSGINQIARYDTTLLKPFFPNPDQWKLAINRMRVPLSGIPLTRNNIPFQQWQVGLDYRPVASGTGGFNTVEYVKQYNQSTTNQYTTYSINNSLGVETYLLTSSSSTLLGTVPLIQPGSTTNQNGLFVQPVLSPDCTKMICLDASNKRQVNVNNTQDGTLITSIDTTGLADYITAIAFDNNNNIYIAKSQLNIPGGQLQAVLSYNYSSSPTPNYTASMTYDFTTQPDIITSLSFDSAASPASNYIFLMSTLGTTYSVNAVQIGSPTIVGTAISDGEAVIISPKVMVNSNKFYILYYNDTIGNYTIIEKDNANNILAQWTNFSQTIVPSLLGFTQTNKLVINANYYDFTGVQIMNTPSDSPSSTYFNPTSGVLNVQVSSIPTIIPVPGGPYDLFTYQDFLNQINAAFQTCFNTMKAEKGATFLPTEPPSIVYNAQTRLFNLIVEGAYLTLNEDGSNQYTIFMNVELWSKFFFPSNTFESSYKSIILQNYGINAVQGNGSASLPQFIYVQQEDSTIYAFYDLVRIIVGTTRIPVSGDGEGKTFSNTGSVSNNAINMITDIVPDTTTLTPGSVLIYVPAGILRWYNLYAQQPFDKVDLTLQYETKDGNVYPIEISNGEFFSVKLEFKKGPGDF